eukprot:6085191-Amphidinium_carterae.1
MDIPVPHPEEDAGMWGSKLKRRDDISSVPVDLDADTLYPLQASPQDDLFILTAKEIDTLVSSKTISSITLAD